MQKKNIARKFLLIFILANINTAVAADAYSQFTINLIDRISNRLFEFAVTTARPFAKITYNDVRFDTNLDTLFVSGLEVIPFINDEFKDCNVRIGSINISSTRNENISYEHFLIGVSDLDIGKWCLPSEVHSSLAIAGIDKINVPFLNIEIDHEYKTAATNFTVYGELEDAVGLTMVVELNYFSAGSSSDRPFIANLKNAHFTLENFGLWENISDEIPNQFNQFGVAGTAASLMASQALKTVLSPKMTDQISTQISDAVNDFISNPVSMAISTEVMVPDGINLDLTTFNNIEYLIELLNPKIFANAALTKSKVTKSDLIEIIDGHFSQFTQDELFELANTINDGDGVPRNSELAKGAYVYLAALGHQEANEKLINLYLFKSDFKNAYFAAQRLGAAGSKSAPAYLNAIEKQIGLVEIMELQSQTDHLNTSGSQSNNIDYDLSRNYLTGNGTIKSFELAYFWALIARASGDIRANVIISKIENIKSKIPDSKAAIWSDRLDQIQTNATQYWMSQN
jgi:hypothetical protein